MRPAPWFVRVQLLTLVVFLFWRTGNAYIVVAGPAVNLETACANGLQVDINGVAAPGPSVTSITWDWGDGKILSGFFPQSHTYASEGQYKVTVTANFTAGGSASASENVTVGSGTLSGCVALTITAGQGGSVEYQASVGSSTIPPGNSATLELDYADDLFLTATTEGPFTGWAISGAITGINGVPVSATSASIEVVVNGTSALTAKFSSASSPPSGASVAPFAVAINNYPDTNIQGFLTFSQAQVNSIVSSIEAQIAKSGGGLAGGGAPIIGVADATHFGLFDLLLAMTGGDQFTSFQDMALESDAISLQNYTGGNIEYAVPPGGSLIIVLPNVEIPSTEPVPLSLSGQYGLLECSNAIDCGSAVTGAVVYYSGGGQGSGAAAETLSASGEADFTESNQQVSLSVPSADPGVQSVDAVVGPSLSDYDVASSSSSSGSASASSTSGDEGVVSASAVGEGVITVGQYASTDPSTGFEVKSCQFFIDCQAAYFDVRTSEGNGFSALTVDECLTGSGSGSPTVSWWNPSGGLFGGGGWDAIGPSSVNDYIAASNASGAQCVNFTLTSTTSPSIADMLGTYFYVLTPAASAHLVTTLQSITADPQTGEYLATITVTNDGSLAASDAAVTQASLNGAKPLTTLPVNVGNLGYEAVTTVTLAFPISAGVPGGRAVLRASESYSGGTAGAGFRVVLP